jgi:60 kDa SS-A/Ro ribonucleoprotein
MSYLKNTLILQHRTPQSEPMREDQTENLAGGYAWAVDPWTRLRRFLILGSESGTYYVGERDLTKKNLGKARACLREDGPRFVGQIHDVSARGLAPKNDPALLALALATVEGDAETRIHAWASLHQIARIPTHLFDFLSFRKALGGGWGRSARRAVSDWYLKADADRLAMHLVKYRQRNGWTHRDVLRLAHPAGSDSPVQPLLAYTAGKWQGTVTFLDPDVTGDVLQAHQSYPHPIIQGYELASRSPNPETTAKLIRQYGLTREMVRTEHLNERAVWEALAYQMPITAMIRNLATMTRVGLLGPMSPYNEVVARQVADPEVLRKGRVHPIQILAALKTYAAGRGVRGQHSWSPVPQVIDALDRAFYASFQSVQPTGKRILVGLDVSGSMAYQVVNGVPNLLAREACAAMALVTVASEPNHVVVAFDAPSSSHDYSFQMRPLETSDGLYPLVLSARQRLDDVTGLLARTGGGGTDCSLPIQYAIDRRVLVDAFVIYTDSETWADSRHPQQALDEYRRKLNPSAKMVVVATTATQTTMRDPLDAGSIEIVGFDPSVPQVISSFIGN